LKEQDVRRNLRPGKSLKRCVRQPDSTDQVGSAGNVFTDTGIFFIHRTFTCDKADDAAGLYKVKGFGNKIIMDQKILVIISLIIELDVVKGDVPDDNVKGVVLKTGGFKALYLDICRLIKLPCDPACDAVQFHAI